MSYRLTEWGASRVPLPHVPWRDMTDEEFAAHGWPSLVANGYFEHEPDAPEIPECSDDDAASPAEILGGRPRRTRRPVAEEVNHGE